MARNEMFPPFLVEGGPFPGVYQRNIFESQPTRCWPGHNPFDDKAHWFSHKDDMGNDRCGGCGIHFRVKAATSGKE